MIAEKTTSSRMRQSARRGASSLALDSRERILEFVSSRANADGGYRGRSGESDLYYTCFGLECLHALDHPFPDRVIEYLDRFGDGPHLDLVHLGCLIRSRALVESLGDQGVMDGFIRRIDAFRTSSGGYSLSRENPADSIYAAFLASLAHEEVGSSVENPEGLMDSIFSLRAGDGAFADKTGTARSTTTVTAAALVLLGRLGQTIDPHAVSCLTSRMKHGGFLAAPSAPVPDLLSTATALFALNTIQYQIDDLPGQIFEFIDACWLEDGGFAGHVLDTVSDCEYTWYGLLSLGCLTGVEACIE